MTFGQIYAQKTDVLAQKISISLTNVSPEMALEQISRIGKFDFAYASGIIPNDYKITYQYDNKSINSILKHLIRDKTIEYKMLGSQVIFYKTSHPETKKSQIILKGYIRDVLTNKPIFKAQIYDAYLPITTISDKNGRYELTIPNPDYALRLTVQAENYLSKNLKVWMTSDRTLNLTLRQKPIDLDQLTLLEPNIPVRPSSDNLGLMNPIETTKVSQMLLPQTSQDYQPKPDKIQTLLRNQGINLGLAPRISTNGTQEGQKINLISLNILVNYSAGSRGLDFAGLMNMNRFNMKGLQFSGLNNLVGGRTAGLQFSGISNVVRLQTSGLQCAGVSNFSGLSMQGVQISGVSNIVRGKMYGIQISGINNLVTEGGRGIQISGINNLMRGKISGIQLAGVGNTSVGQVAGFQFAGIFNTSFKKFDGAQFSGAFNFVSRSARGVQIAGASNMVFGSFSGIQISPINLADTVRGFQIGVINLARKYEYGIPIGLLNFGGYYGIEIGAEETGMVFLKGKTGTKWFYNILSGGIEPTNIHFWKAGYGFGSEWISTRFFKTSLDYTFSYVQESHAEPDFNFLSRLDLNFYYSPLKFLSVFAGVSLNDYTYQLHNLYGEILESQFVPQDFMIREITTKNRLQKTWYGFQMGIRIL